MAGRIGGRVGVLTQEASQRGQGRLSEQERSMGDRAPSWWVASESRCPQLPASVVACLSPSPRTQVLKTLKFGCAAASCSACILSAVYKYI